MAQKDPSRTEKATPRQINKAREKGNVQKSQEVTKTLTIAGGLVGLFIWIGYIGNEIGSLMRNFMSKAILTFLAEAGEVISFGAFVACDLAKMVLPIILFIGLVVFIVLRVQVGKLWTTKVFEPKLSKLTPITGVKPLL